MASLCIKARPPSKLFRPPLIAVAHVARATRTLILGALILSRMSMLSQQANALHIALIVELKQTVVMLVSTHVMPYSCQYTIG